MISFFQTHKPAWKTGVIVIAVAVGAAIFVSAASIGTAALYDMSQRDRIMRGVFILQTDVSGLTKEEALRQVHTQVQEALAQELRFRANAQEYLLTPAENYIQADISAAVERAYASGRSSTLIPNTFVRIGMLLHPITLSIPTKVDRGLIERALREKLNGFLVAPQDASLSITVQNATATPTVTIHPERLGHVIDFAPALDMVEAQARTLTFAPIALKESDVTPALRTTTVEQLATQVPDWLSHAPFKLTADAHLWTVSPAMLAGWIEVTSTSQGWALSLSPSRVETTLNGLAKGLFQEPIDGILTLENGKLKDFQAPQEGILLNPIKTIEEIQLGWEKGSSTVSVILDTVTPKIMGADAEQLGIRERLGVGRSNFAGSPTNRRRNIAKGMSLAHGTLVGPDQEFSMLKTLGVIDGAHGWYPELVIKGNKTTPEFGGGLCQVGTTMFRAALNSGFPITERRNHSY
ncbi:MAG: VanW family protein, partial [Patescibacteria group bacterium]